MAGASKGSGKAAGKEAYEPPEGGKSYDADEIIATYGRLPETHRQSYLASAAVLESGIGRRHGKLSLDGRQQALFRRMYGREQGMYGEQLESFVSSAGPGVAEHYALALMVRNGDRQLTSKIMGELKEGSVLRPYLKAAEDGSIQFDYRRAIKDADISGPYASAVGEKIAEIKGAVKEALERSRVPREAWGNVLSQVDEEAKQVKLSEGPLHQYQETVEELKEQHPDTHSLAVAVHKLSKSEERRKLIEQGVGESTRAFEAQVRGQIEKIASFTPPPSPSPEQKPAVPPAAGGQDQKGAPTQPPQQPRAPPQKPAEKPQPAAA